MRRGVVHLRTVIALIALIGVALAVAVRPATCEVHGAAMKSATVRVVYGRVMLWSDESEARNSLFPHSDDPVSGGCVVGPRPLTTTSVCPVCNVARDEWWAAHPEAGPAKYASDSDPDFPPSPPAISQTEEAWLAEAAAQPELPSPPLPSRTMPGPVLEEVVLP